MCGLSEKDFMFLDNIIDVSNIGKRELYNHFLVGHNPFEQLYFLLNDFKGYVPIGICLDEDYLDCDERYCPVVLENEYGDRKWIHCPYSYWKEYFNILKQIRIFRRSKEKSK